MGGDRHQNNGIMRRTLSHLVQALVTRPWGSRFGRSAKVFWLGLVPRRGSTHIRTPPPRHHELEVWERVSLVLAQAELDLEYVLMIRFNTSLPSMPTQGRSL